MLRWLLVLVTGTGYWYHGTWQLDGYYGIGKGEEEEEGVCVSSAYVKGRSRASVKVGNSVSVDMWIAAEHPPTFDPTSPPLQRNSCGVVVEE